MPHLNIHAPHVAVVGGILPKLRPRLADTGVRCFGGAKHSGNGELQRLLAALHAGTITEVWILWRWLSHTEVERIIGTCKTLGIPHARVTGTSSIRQRLLAHASLIGPCPPAHPCRQRHPTAARD